MKTEIPRNTDVLFLSTKEAADLIEKRTGQTRIFKHAITLLRKNDHRDTILIDSSLPPKIQTVYLVHEAQQLLTIRDYARTGRQIEGILPMAHGNGLCAGIERAKRLGILDEYLKIRGDNINPDLYERRTTE